MWVNIIKTTEGKYVAQARITHASHHPVFETIMYETVEYTTLRMAQADAKCWIAFHGRNAKVDTETIEVMDDDSVYTSSGNRVTGKKFKEILGMLQNNLVERGEEPRKLHYIPANDSDRAFHIEFDNGNHFVTVHRASRDSGSAVAEFIGGTRIAKTPGAVSIASGD
ncbi:MAG TPA: hypothetical protein VN039_05280 [Nitrospira sp.]|nr:hypothetical protein [Nitrospira sp.]